MKPVDRSSGSSVARPTDRPNYRPTERPMMLFMVVEHIHSGRAPDVYRRVRDRGRMMPDGLRYVSSWVDLVDHPRLPRDGDTADATNHRWYRAVMSKWWLVAVLVGAVSVGTWLDTGKLAGPEPLEREYTILAADFHVHSFLGDGALPPWELRREARRRGLDVIAISNHNQLVGAQLGAWLARGGGAPLVLVAQEITTPRFHAIGVGLPETVDWRLPAHELLDRVHALGGVAIAAHPTKESWRVDDASVLRRLDGAEVAHPSERERNAGAELREFFNRAREANANLAPIGSSDFHFVRPLGECRTYVLVDEVSERGVLDAIRAGRTVAQNGRGDLIGDPRFVESVRRYTMQHPVGHEPARAGALAGAIVLVVLGMLSVDARPAARTSDGAR